MKEKKKPLQVIKKIAVTVFCVITVTMNIINYVRGDEYKGLGTVYQWTGEAEITASDADTSALSRNTEDIGNEAETAAFSKVNLNTAGSEELQSLSGIGPSKAAAIIEYRDRYGSFVALEEIMEVPGIGEGIFAKIKDYICIE